MSDVDQNSVFHDASENEALSCCICGREHGDQN